MKPRIPTEEFEQELVFQWAAYGQRKYPELALLHASANGGHRHKATAARLKRTGVKAGVPDMFLPVARNGHHGLFIELKRRKGGRVSPEQKEWLKALNEQGYRAVVCKGADEAIKELKEYLYEKPKNIY